MGEVGAGDGIRTRDILLGKQTLCQLSYSRTDLRSIPPLAPRITAPRTICYLRIVRGVIL